jgi:hypothetical protein
MHIYYNFRYKKSEVKRMSDIMLPLTPLTNVVGARAAGAASKFLPGAGAT